MLSEVSPWEKVNTIGCHSYMEFKKENQPRRETKKQILNLRELRLQEGKGVKNEGNSWRGLMIIYCDDHWVMYGSVVSYCIPEM